MKADKEKLRNYPEASNLHYRYFPFDTFLKKQQELNIRKIQLWGGTPHVWIDPYKADDGRKMKRQAADYGIEIATFRPEFSSMRYCLGISGEAESKKSWEYMKRCVHYGAQLEVQYLLLEINGYNRDRDFSANWEHLLKDMYQLSKILKEEGVDGAVFTDMSDGTNVLNSLERLRSCLNTVNSEYLNPALDLAAMYMAGETVEEWMAAWKEILVYVNITDLDGETFCKDGKVDGNSLLETLNKLKESGYRSEVGVSCKARKSLMDPFDFDEKMAAYFDSYFGSGEKR